MQIDTWLLILRLLLIALLYLFLMQVVSAIRRDLRKTELVSVDPGTKVSSLGHLVVVDSGSSGIVPGTSFKLEGQTSIGRGPTNTIQIPDTDKSISAEHTRLRWHNGLWHVQDAGSVNGTYINNQPVQNNTVTAKPGDTIRVGDIQFKLTQ